MSKTNRERVTIWVIRIVCVLGLLGIYSLTINDGHKARMEHDALIKSINDLKAGNAELEKRNQELYVDFCQEAEWLQECQSSLKRPVEERDWISKEYINNALRIKR